MNLYPLLAFDTAAGQCAVALLGPDEVFAAHAEMISTGQAERLLPMIQAVLNEAKLRMADIGGIAVTTGPGSFTGVRVGLATAHGLALSLGMPATGIDSFQAFAYSAPQATGHICVVIESRRLEKFWQVFDANLRPVTDPACDLPETIAARLPDGIRLAGNAAQTIEIFRPELKIVYAAAGPDVVFLGRLAAMAHPEQAQSPLPLYVRPPDARLPNA